MTQREKVEKLEAENERLRKQVSDLMEMARGLARAIPTPVVLPTPQPQPWQPPIAPWASPWINTCSSAQSAQVEWKGPLWNGDGGL